MSTLVVVRSHRLLPWLSALALVCASALTLASACEVEPDKPQADRQDVLRELSANVIVATYVDIANSTAELATAAQLLRRAPSLDTLSNAQRLYRGARLHQKTSEAMFYGPAEDIAVTGSAIDAWPTNGKALDDLTNGTAALTQTDVAVLAANQRGFPALEYLLFDSSVSDAEVLARFTTASTAARRSELTESVAAELAARTRRLADAFGAPGGYGSELAEAGLGSKTFSAQSQGIDKVVTGLVYVTELMVMKKLAKPLGVDSNNVIDPADEEGPRSDSTLTDLEANLLGVKAIYSGTLGARVGKGLADPVRAINPGAATRFEQALDAALAAVDAVPPPFRTALVQNRAAVDAAYQATRALKTSIQTDLAGALGASLGFGFSDTD